MGRRPGRLGGMAPIDTLSSSMSRRDPVPTRYTSHRKDPKVIQELNRASVRDFMPEVSANSSFRASQTHESGDRSPMENHVTIESDAPLQATPVRKRQKLAASLILSSPDNSSDIAPGAQVCKSSGMVRVVMKSGKELVKSNSVLKIVNDDEGIRFSMRWKGADIEGSQVDFLRDCERVYFDALKSHMGILLKHSRCVDLDDICKTEKTKILLWSSSAGADVNLIRLKEIIKNSMIESVVLSNRLAILGTMKQAVARQELEAFSKRRFWEKPEFQSLGKRHAKSSKSSSGSSGFKITIPNETESEKEDKASHNAIPSTQFYADGNTQSSPQSTNSLREHTLSSLRRSTRTNKAPSPDCMSFDDSCAAYEKPEVFKPSLFYKFDDNTTLSVTNQDFKCLYNHDWINDSILDFFVKYWTEESIKQGTVFRDKVHVLSSFFYTKLISNPENYYYNVKKWVNHTDLFKKQYLVMPININYHWFGCIIENLPSLFSFLERERKFKEKHQKSADSEESENSDELSVTSPIVTILVYDSLRQTHSREVEPIKEFLIAYAADKYGLEVSKNQIKMKSCLVPQQPNMSDCGVHVILNTRKFFENPTKTFELWKSAKSKNKTASKVINEYFEKKERLNARSDLRNVLWKLQQKQIEFNKLNGVSEIDEADGIKSDGEHSDIEIIENYEQPATKPEQGFKQVDDQILKHRQSQYSSSKVPENEDQSNTCATDTEASSRKDVPLLNSELPRINMPTGPATTKNGVKDETKVYKSQDRRFLESSPEVLPTSLPEALLESSAENTGSVSKYFVKAPSEHCTQGTRNGNESPVLRLGSTKIPHNALLKEKDYSAKTLPDVQDPHKTFEVETLENDEGRELRTPSQGSKVLGSPSSTNGITILGSLAYEENTRNEHLSSSPNCNSDDDVRLVSTNSVGSQDLSSQHSSQGSLVNRLSSAGNPQAVTPKYNAATDEEALDCIGLTHPSQSSKASDASLSRRSVNQGLAQNAEHRTPTKKLDTGIGRSGIGESCDCEQETSTRRSGVHKFRNSLGCSPKLEHLGNLGKD
ncbi:LAQU0S10e03158g1_1 [Lachancea quebecensis]|uniref:LAQU0S10e03158g1_1 n=1 Tax=Lachancea quebecensis TaxID=1654605 RepID=A0A0P1KTK3_9SACH|nr:LAQU0S10e03158g1_1 [Lachancea quebecensis]